MHGLAVKVSGHRPPLPAVGLSRPRVRDAVPPAHVTEQVAQLDQAPTMQSTACIEGEPDGTVVGSSVGEAVVGLRTKNKSLQVSNCPRLTSSLGCGSSHLGDGDGVGEASNTIEDPVPIIAATTIRRPSTWPAVLAMLVQAAEVAEVQLIVEHKALASEREAAGSEIPNCKPEIVSSAPPESGAFTLCDEDTTGAAKEDKCVCFALKT